MVRSAAAVLAVLILPSFALAQEPAGTHRVIDDDTLWDLAVNYYQDPFEWRTIWEANSLRKVGTFGGFLQGTHSVAFSPDQKYLAVGSDSKEAVKLWELESQHELLTLEGQGAIFHKTAFSPDGNIIGSMNGEGLLHLWRAPSWEEINTAETSEHW